MSDSRKVKLDRDGLAEERALEIDPAEGSKNVVDAFRVHGLTNAPD